MHHPDRRAPRLRAQALALALAIASPLAFADSVDELRALVDANDKAAAWDMAQRMEPENAGDPDFDFWYGLAAKAAGKKHEAVFAFERVVANQPGNARAKLELGDVYYQFGNATEAKRLFDEVLATTPPEPVEQRIRNYLGAIEAAEARKTTQVGGYVAIAAGHDSNVNSATSVGSHDIVGFPYPLTLAAAALETESAFIDLRAGVDIVQPVDQRQVRFLNLALQSRDNEDFFSGGNSDYLNAVLSGGWLLQHGTARWRIPVNVQALSIESDDSRYLGTLGLEYSRPLAANTSLAWFGQLGSIHYPSQEARNAQLALAGGAWTWNGTTLPLRVSTSLQIGTEPAEDSDFEFNGRDYVAARVNARYAYSASQSVYGALGVQQSQYQDVQPLLGIEREETLADAALGWQWQIERDWRVNADVTYANNASADNALYDYDRTVVMLGSTWRF